MDTRRYATFLQNVGRLYNNALLIVLSNNTGLAVVRFLILDEYPNIYFDAKVNGLMSVTLQMREVMKSDKHLPGFATTGKTRPLMILKMLRAFRNKLLIIHSMRTILLLRTFIWKPSGKPLAASAKYHDDLVMSLAIGLYTRDTSIRIRLQARQISQKDIQ